MLFIQLQDNSWYEVDKEKLMAFNYHGGYHYISQDELNNAHTFECTSWHELYTAKHYCPLETTIRCHNGWLSPDGKIYDATSHEVTAEELLEIIYGIEPTWAGDELEAKGWVRITTSLMWDIRLDDWTNKQLTQKQQDVLWDWCQQHRKKYPITN